jgi:hypothetical protein
LKNSDQISRLLKFLFTLTPAQQISESVVILKTDIDWEKSFYFLARAKIALAVWSILKASSFAVSEKSNMFKNIKTEHLASAVLNLRYQEELLLILNLFRQKLVDVVVLKGPFLAERLYQDIAARGIGADLDLLIKENDRFKAKNILEDIGYQFWPSVETKKFAWSDNYSKANLPMIDLHWDITLSGRSLKRIEGLWSNARLVDYKSIKYYDFMPEELLLFLAANFSNTEISRQLRYLCDILRLISIYNDRLDWDRLISKAKQWKLNGPLYAALYLAFNLGLSNFPKNVFKKISLSLSQKFFICILINKRHIFNPGLFVRVVDRFFSNFLYEAMVAENMHDYINFLKRLFYPSLVSNHFTSVFKRIIKGISKIYCHSRQAVS